MERNLEEMIRSLEEEKREIEIEMNSQTDSKIASKMKKDLKKIEEEIEKLKAEEVLIALGDKKREIEDALKSESDPKIRYEMKTDLLRIEAEIQEKSNKYGLKNREDNQKDKLSREDAINKSRELQKGLEILKNHKQQISNTLREENDLKIIYEINNDLMKIEQEIESKTNKLNLLKSTYKISETEMQVELPEPEPKGNSEEMTMEELLGTASEPEQEPFSESDPPKDSEILTKEEIEELLGTASESEQEPPEKPDTEPASEVEPESQGNSEEMTMEELLELFRAGTLTREEIEELLGTASESEQEPPEKPKTEPMKAKNEYDWGELTKDQIDELWAEGIVPGSQEYKQAYGNFAPGILTYKPEVHDIEPEAELGSEETETEAELGSEETETEEELGSEETEQTPPQEEELTEEETKAHGNRLAKMLGTFSSWVANKAKVGGEKVAESDQKEDSNLPAPVKEGNFFTRIGKAIGNKVAQWQQEVTAEEENSAYYDEETYSEAKKKREEREEVKENRKAEKAKAKREKKNIEEELKSGVAEGVNEILDRDPEGDTEKESEEQDRPNLVGYDTRDIGFIKKWMEGELRRPVRVELEGGRRAWLGPDGKIDYEAEKNPWILKEDESVNAVNQKEGEPTEKVADSDGNAQEDTMTDKAETLNPWEVEEDVKKATEEAGRQAGEKKEVLVLKGDAVVTGKGNVVCALDEDDIGLE